ncbi:MAG: asparagine synthase (glutamine-hydrolyzing) [Clostridia bacterium]|nr:asparagine synthase (glutamine-hydrolyzing) [Clostridia bacterium]
MCGFVGFSSKNNISGEILEKMLERIVHRGPDSSGRYMDDNIALGFRRLSIIDLEHGSQPLYNEQGDLVLLFNGEIYNFRALREELLAAGHVFNTETDSEVVLHGYEEWGADMLPRLRGMFAFVIWNSGEKKLFAARDRFGIKPFYYAEHNGTFMFGSEIKSLLPHPDFHRELNYTALENYLSFQYAPGAETVFKGVYRLMPAHCFTYTRADGKLEIKRWWEPGFEAVSGKGLKGWADEVAGVFADSVKAHMVSDVEVGSFLSGGVDSAYAATISQVKKTFTVGFDIDGTDRYNEIGKAANIAKHINAANYPRLITPGEFWRAVPLVQYHMDEPMADSSAIALFFLCRHAAKQVKVVLSGEGSDELFGGYNVYKEPQFFKTYTRLPLGFRASVAKLVKKLHIKRGLNFFVRRGVNVEDRFIGNAYIFTKEERESLLRVHGEGRDPAEICRPVYERAYGKDDVTKMQYIDLNFWLPGDILLKADKMSMASSLELRVPFLDKEVMNTASHIPTRYRASSRKSKIALREAAKRVLPQDDADRRKLGFPVPIRVWLKEDEYYNKVRESFTSEAAEKLFDTQKLIALLDDHRKGVADNSRKIWTLYTFLVWYGVYFGSGDPASVEMPPEP